MNRFCLVADSLVNISGPQFLANTITNQSVVLTWNASRLSSSNVTLLPQYAVVTSRVDLEHVPPQDEALRSRDAVMLRDVNQAGAAAADDDVSQYEWRFADLGRWFSNQSSVLVTGLRPYTTYRVGRLLLRSVLSSEWVFDPRTYKLAYMHVQFHSTFMGLQN